jgi:hypothetical protein
MRLTKTAYLYGEREIIGYGDFGRPIYGNPEKILFKMEIEPYSAEKAQYDYGTFVTAQYRLFTKPDSRLKLNEEIEYKGKIYSIADPPKDYDKHYEVLIKFESDVS